MVEWGPGHDDIAEPVTDGDAAAEPCGKTDWADTNVDGICAGAADHKIG